MRKYLRAIARQRMKAAGIERMNKPFAIRGGEKIYRKSFFARHWRKYTTTKPAKRKRLRAA